MPNDVKAVISLITLLVAAGMVYWEYANGREDLAWVVIGTAIFMVISMWVFPEAGVKKSDRRN